MIEVLSADKLEKPIVCSINPAIFSFNKVQI
jgi:hypothetical protein